MDGRILFHGKGAELPAKYQLLVSFTDGTALTATVGLWGFFGVGDVVPVDQSKTIDPLGREFTLARFERLFAEYPKPNHPIKAFLINRPRLRGFGNGYMQEMLFRAGILPTRTVASLDRDERRRLHRAVRGVLAEADPEGRQRRRLRHLRAAGEVREGPGGQGEVVHGVPDADREAVLPRRRDVLLPAVPEVGGPTIRELLGRW